jgi:hypothetical protein
MTVGPFIATSVSIIAFGSGLFGAGISRQRWPETIMGGLWIAAGSVLLMYSPLP